MNNNTGKAIVKAIVVRMAARIGGSLGVPTIVVILALFAVPLAIVGGSVALTASNLPNTENDLGPGPTAKELIPSTMLELYQSIVVKRECPATSWSIVAAINHLESNDGRDPGPSPDSAEGQGKVNSSGDEPRWGPSQMTLSTWDPEHHQAVVKFRVKPDITPDGKTKAPNFNNPNNPWDTGYANAVNSSIAIAFGWSGQNVGDWDYSSASPMVFTTPKTHRQYTTYVYNPSTNGPLGDRIPYYRLQDGKGMALDGNGDGDADIMDPGDSVPASARFLCAHGGDQLATLINAIVAYHPEWSYFYLSGGHKSDGTEFRGVLPLSKQLTQGGEVIPPSVAGNFSAPPGGEPTATAIGNIPANMLALYQSDAVKQQCPGLPWTVVAAVIHLESGDGTNQATSSAGAMGPAQFLPDTWAKYGLDANGDGVANVMDPADAVPSAAHYLCVLGGGNPATLAQALYGYNHAWWYVYGGTTPQGDHFPGILPVANQLGSGGLGTITAPDGAAGSQDCPGLISVLSTANLPGRPITPETMRFLCVVANILGKPLNVSTGTNHNKDVVENGVDTGRVSDHYSGNAADFLMTDNGGQANNDGDISPNPVGDALAKACLMAAGDSPDAAEGEAIQGGLYTRVYGGYRIQCIWKTDSGGNHFNHVHIGAVATGETPPALPQQPTTGTVPGEVKYALPGASLSVGGSHPCPGDQPATDRLQFRQDVSEARSGQISTKIEVHPGQRTYGNCGIIAADAIAGSDFNGRSGEEGWYGISMKFPTDWPNGGGHFQEIKEWLSTKPCLHPGYGDITWDLSNPHVLTMSIQTGRKPSPSSNTCPSSPAEGQGDWTPMPGSGYSGSATIIPNLQLGVWYDFVYHFVWSPCFGGGRDAAYGTPTSICSSSTPPGLMEVWYRDQNSTQFVKAYTGIHPTLEWNAKNGVSDAAEYQMIYKGATNVPASYWFAGWRRGTTLESILSGFQQPATIQP